ncbi:MAG: hypothetical protein J7L58_04750 [Thermoplasmata archaeon]|nr:hypothetical protein [Thermoplasmata archaeon]
MRMVVSLIIGAATLATIIAVISKPCLFPKTLTVEITNRVVSEGTHIPIYVTVKDDKGKPIKGASVTITGLDTGASNITDINGKTTIYLDLQLPEYRKEGYLDIEVFAGSCYKKFHQENAIKVVRS